jgi:hypothetical protein
MRITVELQDKPAWDSIVFHPWSHRLEPKVRMNQAAHSHQKLLQFYSYYSQGSPWPVEFLLEIPRSWSFHPVGQTWLRADFPPGAYQVQKKLRPLLFGVQSGKSTQRVGTPGQRRTWNTIGWHAASVVPSSCLLQCRSASSQWLKGPKWLQSHWVLQKRCGNIVQRETKQHSEK